MTVRVGPAGNGVKLQREGVETDIKKETRNEPRER